MADKEKQLAFSIAIEGVSNEAQQLAQIEIHLKNIKNVHDELLKQSTKPGHIASNEERQKLAAYNKEIGAQEAAYKGLKKVIDSAPDSLNRMRQRLIEMRTEAANASGTLRTQMVPGINKLNSEILNIERSMGTHSRNVGNYRELLTSLPGPIGAAATSVEGLVTKFGKFGPVGAIIGGGLLAISAPLMAFFKYSEEGVELLERKVSGFKAAWSVLIGEMIDSGDKIVSALDKPEKKMHKFWTVVMNGLGPAWAGVGLKMDMASKAAEEWTRAEQQLEDTERSLIVTRAESNLNIARTTEIANNEKLTINERLTALKETIRVEDEQNAKEVQIQKQKTIIISLINDQKRATGQLRDADEKRLQESIAAEINLEAQSTGREKRTLIRIKKLTDDNDKYNTYLKAGTDEWDKQVDLIADAIVKEARLVDLTKEEFEELGKKVSSIVALIESIEQSDIFRKVPGNVKKGSKEEENLDPETQALRDSLPTYEEVMEQRKQIHNKVVGDQVEADKKHRDLEMSYIQAGVEAAGMAANTIFNIKNNNLDAQMKLELSNKNLTEVQKAAIEKKYAKEKQKMAIMQAIINGALGITSSLTGLPIVKWIEVALVAATTIAEVALIKSQKFASGGFTRPGSKYEAAGIVHAGEWVAPQEMVRSRTTGPIISALERQRVSFGGSGLMNRNGYASGGFVDNSLPNIPSPGIDYDRIINGINNKYVILDVNKLNSAQSELQVINQSQRI
jgi:hypothetical protein